MSILDSITSGLGGMMGEGVQQQVAGMIAQKMGLDPATVEQAVGALLKNHTEPNDTVQAAAEQTGVDSGTMGQILEHIGGEGALGSLLGQVAGGAGGQEGGLGGMLSGLVGNLMGGNKS